MRHLICLFVVCFFGACPKERDASGVAGQAATGAAQQPVQAVAQRITNPFLYRIEKGTAVSYALGTFHVGVMASQLPDEVNAAMRSAKTAVFETEMPTGPALQRLITRTDGRTLRQELGEKHWAILVKKFGAGAEQLNSFTTAMVTMFVMMSDLPRRPGLDIELLAQVKSYGLATQFLEDINAQAALLTKFYDVNLLRLYVEQPQLAIQGLTKMQTYYEAGDAQGLVTEMQDESAWRLAGKDHMFVQAFNKEMLDDRTQNWLIALGPQFDAGGLFIAVGVGHLIGEKGLIALLEKQGYQVTRISAK